VSQLPLSHFSNSFYPQMESEIKQGESGNVSKWSQVSKTISLAGVHPKKLFCLSVMGAL